MGHACSFSLLNTTSSTRRETRDYSSSQDYKMKTAYVVLLVVLAAIALEAKPRSEGQVQRMLQRVLQDYLNGEPSICPHCATLKSGCYCSYQKMCTDRACFNTGACKPDNCVALD